jgi:hypothetical protein
MPDQETLERAEKDAREGKSPSTQAGEFVREEIHHIREGKHGARSSQQAIAIGLSEARRAGVKLSPPKGPAARKKAAQDAAAGRKAKASLRKTKTSAKRSRASEAALKRESRGAASHEALSRQAKKSAVNFHGKARLDAKLSHTVTGWKAILLKPADPFFSKNGVGTELPVKVTGMKSEPHFGSDFGHKDDSKNSKGGPRN